MRKFFGLGTRIGIVALILGLSAGAYAFTASNTVSSSLAGDGNGTISGYTITNFSYALNGTNPRNVDSFTFNLSNTANTVYAYANGTGNLITCTSGATNPVKCPASGSASIPVATFNSVEVVSAQ